MKKIIFTLILLIGFFIFTLQASACQCVANQTLSDKLNQANFVFSGKVINVDRPLTGIIGGDDPVKVTFKVSSVWVGNITNEIMINNEIIYKLY